MREWIKMSLRSNDRSQYLYSQSLLFISLSFLFSPLLYSSVSSAYYNYSLYYCYLLLSIVYQPVERYWHSTVQVGDYLYMWGGSQPGLPRVHNNEEKKSMCSVVEVCHVPTGTWVQKPTTGNPPLGVYGYATAVIRNEIFFYGGRCGHEGCYHNSLYR